MERTSFADMSCSLARTLELAGDWWSPLIVRDLFLGVGRFDDLAEDLGISRNLLTRRLKLLVENGIVSKRLYQSRPRRYEYVLTAAGLDLVPALLALTAWGDRWAGLKEGRPMLFRHEPCGHFFEPNVTCSECGGEIEADAVAVLPGPGGRMGPGTKVVARKLKAG
jgi:DNA-binding HxlR family transcriptional regulator